MINVIDEFDKKKLKTSENIVKNLEKQQNEIKDTLEEN